MSAIKRLRRELKKYMRERKPDDAFVLEIPGDDMLEWHFTIRGPPDSDYQHGIYHGKIKFPTQYPLRAPDVVFLTPSERFQVGKMVCISGITGFHSETWSPTWGPTTLLRAIQTFIVTEENGIGAIVGSKADLAPQRKAAAERSRSWRCKACGSRSNLEIYTEANQVTDGMNLGGSGGNGAGPGEVLVVLGLDGSEVGAPPAQKRIPTGTEPLVMEMSDDEDTPAAFAPTIGPTDPPVVVTVMDTGKRKGEAEVVTVPHPPPATQAGGSLLGGGAPPSHPAAPHVVKVEKEQDPDALEVLPQTTVWAGQDDVDGEGDSMEEEEDDSPLDPAMVKAMQETVDATTLALRAAKEAEREAERGVSAANSLLAASQPPENVPDVGGSLILSKPVGAWYTKKVATTNYTKSILMGVAGGQAGVYRDHPGESPAALGSAVPPNSGVPGRGTTHVLGRMEPSSLPFGYLYSWLSCIDQGLSREHAVLVRMSAEDIEAHNDSLGVESPTTSRGWVLKDKNSSSGVYVRPWDTINRPQNSLAMDELGFPQAMWRRVDEYRLCVGDAISIGKVRKAKEGTPQQQYPTGAPLPGDKIPFATRNIYQVRGRLPIEQVWMVRREMDAHRALEKASREAALILEKAKGFTADLQARKAEEEEVIANLLNIEATKAQLATRATEMEQERTQMEVERTEMVLQKNAEVDTWRKVAEQTAGALDVMVSEGANSTLKGIEKAMCGLCQGIMLNPATLECGHCACVVCMRDWLKNQSRCAICQAQTLARPENLKPNILLRDLINALVEKARVLPAGVTRGFTEEEVQEYLAKRDESTRVVVLVEEWRREYGVVDPKVAWPAGLSQEFKLAIESFVSPNTRRALVEAMGFTVQNMNGFNMHHGHRGFNGRGAQSMKLPTLKTVAKNLGIAICRSVNAQRNKIIEFLS